MSSNTTRVVVILAITEIEFTRNCYQSRWTCAWQKEPLFSNLGQKKYLYPKTMTFKGIFSKHRFVYEIKYERFAGCISFRIYKIKYTPSGMVASLFTFMTTPVI